METRPHSSGRWFSALLGATIVLALNAPSPIQADTPTCSQKVTDFATYTACMGTFPDPTYAPGRPYGLMVPDGWNGTLVLVSPGYAYPGSPPPSSSETSGAQVDQSWILNVDSFDKWLLHNGYAVATSWSGTGWTVHASLENQIATLDAFTSMFGAPTRTIAYGGSLGGMITAGLIQQHPDRFAGGMSVNGVLAGAVGAWNAGLDFEFVVQQLLGSQSGLQVVHVSDPGGNIGLAMQILGAAQGTVRGRARIALACAVYDMPGWFDPLSSEPASDAYGTQEFNQFLWANYVLTPVLFGAGRTDVEQRAGGNPSWNTAVNYRAQLEKSVDYAEVLALYENAGLSLDDDLARLADAPRIAADPAAVEYMSESISYDGDLGGVPLLALHTTGDGFVTNPEEFAYRSAVLDAKDSQLLKQAFVHRAGHGGETLGEIVAAFQALLHRIEGGKWDGSASPDALNAAALALGPSFNVYEAGGGVTIPMPPAYLDYSPAPFLRPYGLDDPAPLVTLGASAELPKSAGPVASTRPLNAWPLPYQGGALQVSFSLGAGAGAGASAEVAIYDLSGRQVRLWPAVTRDGAQLLQWDGRDANGIAVGNGVYFLRARSGGQSAQLKFVVVR